jgi:hypothetical protein
MIQTWKQWVEKKVISRSVLADISLKKTKIIIPARTLEPACEQGTITKWSLSENTDKRLTAFKS